MAGITTPVHPDRIKRRAVGGRSHHDALRGLAFVGLIARGVVYGVIGGLSLALALGAGGKTTSQSGAMQTIARQPLGDVLLLGLAAGLAAYAIFRLIEGITGGAHRGKDRTQHRVAAIGSAIAYAALCYTAINVLDGRHTGGGSPRHAAAGILGWPGGPVIVAAAGCGVIGIGLYQAHKGLTRRFLEDTDTSRLSSRARRAFTVLGVTGHLARAVTFALIGYALIRAAVDYSARAAIGLDGALQKLAHSSNGPVLLGIVAIGFIAFAVYSIVDSRYRRV